MNARLRWLFTPPRLWPLPLVTVPALLAFAALTADIRPGNARGNALVYANGEPVPRGEWSVLCIDTVAYLAITTARGFTVVPKYRRNGLPEPCHLPVPAGE